MPEIRPAPRIGTARFYWPVTADLERLENISVVSISGAERAQPVDNARQPW
jgi:hypothetical protein